MLLYQLSRPAAYLTIKDHSKKYFDWIIPFVLTIIISSIYFLFPSKTSWLGETGIIENIKGFLQIFPGFYLTALAAVSTFNKKELDFELPEPAPTINIKFTRNSNLVTHEINLTRRRLLSYLFGYLTFLSFMLYIVAILSPILLPGILASFQGAAYGNIIVVFLKTIYQLFFWQMILITMFGLYQLCDRIHLSGSE